MDVSLKKCQQFCSDADCADYLDIPMPNTHLSWYESWVVPLVISIVFVGDYQKNEVPEIMMLRACQIKQAFDMLSETRKDFIIGDYAYHGQLTPTLCAGKYLIAELRKNGLITYSK